MSRYKIYLKDIWDAIKKIEESTKDISLDKIKDNKDIWDATLMRLQVIGESIKKVPLEIKKKYKEIEWGKLAKLRDVISHAYFIVNTNIIRDIIENKLPELKKQIKRILEKENE